MARPTECDGSACKWELVHNYVAEETFAVTQLEHLDGPTVDFSTPLDQLDDEAEMIVSTDEDQRSDTYFETRDMYLECRTCRNTKRPHIVEHVT